MRRLTSSKRIRRIKLRRKRARRKRMIRKKPARKNHHPIAMKGIMKSYSLTIYFSLSESLSLAKRAKPLILKSMASRRRSPSIKRRSPKSHRKKVPKKERNPKIQRFCSLSQTYQHLHILAHSKEIAFEVRTNQKLDLDQKHFLKID